MAEAPQENNFVQVTFEGEFGNQSPIKGRVKDVDEDPDLSHSDLVFVVKDKEGGRDIVYGEGIHEGEEYAAVSVKNRNIQLGENAEWRFLE